MFRIPFITIGFVLLFAITFAGWVDSPIPLFDPIEYDNLAEFEIIPCDTDMDCLEKNPHIGQEFID